MSDLALRTNTSIALVDADKLAARIKLMIFNGKKLSDDETMALATYAAVNDLNPFVSECYYLPGVGPTPGIAGWRKKADEQLEYEARRAACPSARFWCDYLDTEPRETGALLAGDIAVKAVLHDTITKMQWEQSILKNMIELLKNKIENAASLAQEIAGPEPTWSAVGIVRAVENFGPDKMPRYERACKRAEKAAIRKRFPRVYLPEPAGYDDVVDGSFVEQPTAPMLTQAQALTDLGVDPIQPTHDGEPPIEQNQTAQSEFQNIIDQEPALQDVMSGKEPIDWPPELITHLTTSNLGVKDYAKCVEMLNRSKMLTITSPQKHFDMYVNWYCQARKGEKNEVDSADEADHLLANILAANDK